MVFNASMDDRKRKQALETTHYSFRKRKKSQRRGFYHINKGIHYLPQFMLFPHTQNHEKCFTHDHIPNIRTKTELSQVQTKYL